MTIVHVIPFLWSGAGRVVIRLCEAQRRDGHAVHVVTSVKSRGLSDWQPHRRAAARLGVQHHRIDTFDRAPSNLETALSPYRPRRVEVNQNTVTVTLKGQESRALDLVADLGRLGHVLRLEVAGASLEDIFIELTSSIREEAR